MGEARFQSHGFQDRAPRRPHKMARPLTQFRPDVSPPQFALRLLHLVEQPGSAPAEPLSQPYN